MTRRVVFASGKGGTGKTTLAALMAIHAAREMPLVLADCDVEAANLPLALGAEDVSREPFAGWPAAAIDAAACNSCGVCLQVCRFEAVVYSGVRRDFSIDPLLCEGCALCASACPYDAIVLTPRESGEVIVARSAAGPLVYGRLRPGQDLSGKLVTEVRTLADRLADDGAAELVLVDGPPGTGCPATAAIANTDLLIAVAEPTVSGEHDLARLIALARRLGVPVAIVLNKADLSASGALRIRERAAIESLPVIAEVPFDPALAALAQRAELGTLFAADVEAGSGVSAGLPGLKAVQAAWDDIRSRILD